MSAGCEVCEGWTSCRARVARSSTVQHGQCFCQFDHARHNGHGSQAQAASVLHVADENAELCMQRAALLVQASDFSSEGRPGTDATGQAEALGNFSSPSPALHCSCQVRPAALHQLLVGRHAGTCMQSSLNHIQPCSTISLQWLSRRYMSRAKICMMQLDSHSGSKLCNVPHATLRLVAAPSGSKAREAGPCMLQLDP